MVSLLILSALLSTQKKGLKPPLTLEPTRFYLIQEVPLTKPVDLSHSNLPEDVLSWKGWKYLSSAGGVSPSRFMVDGDWTSAFAPVIGHLPAADSPSWHVKVIVLRRTDGLLTSADGTLSQLRATLEAGRLQEYLEALYRAVRMFEGQSGNRLKVDVQVQQDEEPFKYECAKDQVNDPDHHDPTYYLKARINGGSFVADDKIYRGPYNQVLLLWPMPTNTVEQRTINGMPLTCISTVTGSLDPGLFTTRLLSALDFAVDLAANKHGIDMSALAPPVGQLKNPFFRLPMPPAELASFDPISGVDYVKNFHTPLPMMPDSIQSVGSLAPLSSNTVLKLTPDRKFGQVLYVQLNGLHKRGGFTLPDSSSGSSLIDQLKTGVLTFSMMTSSVDPLHVGVFSDGKMVDVASLGDGPEGGLSADVPGDGKWHTVSIDFRPILAKNPAANAVYIGADPSLTPLEKRSFLAIMDQFSNFSVQPNPPADSVAERIAPEPADMAKIREIRSQTSFADNPTQIQLFETSLQDPSSMVRLNTLNVLCNIKAPELVPPIIGAFVDVDGRINEEGAKALIFQHTDPALAFLRVALDHGPGPRARAAAGLALSELKQPDLSAPLSAMIGLRTWQGRQDGAIAVNANGGPQANELLSTFLSDNDPEVRLTAVNLIEITDEAAMKKVLFNSVNDPSDLVRATACERLLLCNFPDLQTQGLRGFTDDSWWVRNEILSWIGNGGGSPAIARDAIVSSLNSLDPRIASSALKALGTYQQSPTLPELGNTLNDIHPLVQFALEELALKKSIQLQPSTIQELSTSVDPKVVQEAGKLTSLVGHSYLNVVTNLAKNARNGVVIKDLT